MYAISKRVPFSFILVLDLHLGLAIKTTIVTAIISFIFIQWTYIYILKVRDGLCNRKNIVTGSFATLKVVSGTQSTRSWKNTESNTQDPPWAIVQQTISHFLLSTPTHSGASDSCSPASWDVTPHPGTETITTSQLTPIFSLTDSSHLPLFLPDQLLGENNILWRQIVKQYQELKVRELLTQSSFLVSGTPEFDNLLAVVMVLFDQGF